VHVIRQRWSRNLRKSLICFTCGKAIRAKYVRMAAGSDPFGPGGRTVGPCRHIKCAKRVGIEISAKAPRALS
jgi:hypothetical protein